MRRFSIFLYSTVVICFSLTGCSMNNASPSHNQTATVRDTQSSVTEKKPQVFRFNFSTEPPTADPGILDDLASDSITRATFEGLTRIGQDNKPHEAAAEKIEISPDSLTYTFTIRDAKWSNREKVTAFDFEFAWKRVLKPETGSKSANKMYYLKNGEKAYKGIIAMNEVGVKALNEKTLQVTLENPTPYFLELVAYPTFYPVSQKVVQSNSHWADEATTHIGNGPFKIAQWEHKNKMTLIKNDNYWDKNFVKLDKMELSMIPEANTELAMFENGQLDFAGQPLGSIPLDAMPTLKENGKLVSQLVTATYIYKVNTKKVPFNNANIRKAFAYAINRKEIIENVAQGNQIPALSLLPASMSAKSSGYFKDGDVEMAKKLLDQGMRELRITKLPTITLSYNTSEAHKKIAEAIQDQWKKTLGIDVQLENQEWAVLLEKIQHRDYQIARLGWAAQYNDPINFLESYKEKEGANNSTGWENSEYKDLLSQSFVESNTEKRKNLLAKAEQILMDEMPIVPIYYYTNNYVKHNNVHGFFISDTGSVDWKWVSIE